MKILIEVAQGALPQIQEWIPCQGFRLRENQDGSFSLMVTHDLKAARQADLDVHQLIERAKRERPPQPSEAADERRNAS